MEEMKAIMRDAVITALKTVYDPEIPVNIYSLGLIYEIHIDDDYFVRIVMTLTAPNCPMAESLPIEVRDAVRGVEGVKDAEVEVVFDPPWDVDKISEEAKLDLGLL
jgi:FeS assembly SUF system protein